MVENARGRKLATRLMRHTGRKDGRHERACRRKVGLRRPRRVTNRHLATARDFTHHLWFSDNAGS